MSAFQWVPAFIPMGIIVAGFTGIGGLLYVGNSIFRKKELNDPLRRQWTEVGLRTRFCPTMPSLYKEGFLDTESSVSQLHSEIRGELEFLQTGADAMLATARASKANL